MRDLLNPYQRSSLRTTLLSFEKSLRTAKAWLDGKEEYGILYRAKIDLSAARREEAQREIESALEQIAELSRVLEIEKEEADPLSMIRAEMSVAWANLWDSRSNKLARFGKVAEGLSQRLDPDIIRLADIAQRLVLVFSDSTSLDEEKDA